MENIKKPSILLLKKSIYNNHEENEELLQSAKNIEKTLSYFNITSKVTDITKGPSTTMYEIKVDPSVNIKKIINISDNLKMNLAVQDIRIIAPIPGKNAIGIETSNNNRYIVRFREMIENEEFIKSKSDLTVAIGKDINGNNIYDDISKMPHLLIAGATGSGKSVFINNLIMSLIYKSNPNEVKMIMIDPKIVELSIYNDIPHLLEPVIFDSKKASKTLEKIVDEMQKRYSLFASVNAKDINSYNEKVNEDKRLYKIVVIIDELADLMQVATKSVETSISRIAQLARAAGIHLIIATQRPSVDVITGIIKANMPTRISFAVTSNIDSRTILDMSGAEKLMGNGDMLYLTNNKRYPERLQSAFLAEDEIINVVDYIKK